MGIRYFMCCVKYSNGFSGLEQLTEYRLHKDTNVYHDSYYIFFDSYWVDMILYRFSLVLQQYIWQVPYIYILATKRRRRRCCTFGRSSATIDEILTDCDPSDLSDASNNLMRQRTRSAVSDPSFYSPR